MTNDNTTANDSSKQKTSTRRKVLKGIGAVGIGAGLGVGGVYTIADQSDHADTTDFTGPEQPEKAPEWSEPDDTTPPRTTPWNKENIVFSIDRADNISGDTHVPVQLNKAAEFWNDYIENNVQFDLTLTFEPNHSNPDILFIQENIVDCLGEYESPAADRDDLAQALCVETLREAPQETPVESTISMGGNGEATFGLLAKHGLGRLIGFDIWSDPVDVMTPKILFTPSHYAHPDATSLLSTPSRGAGDIQNLADMGTSKAENLREFPTKKSLENVSSELSSFVKNSNQDMSQWSEEAENIGFPGLVTSYEEAVLNDDIAYTEETIALVDDLRTSKTNEEIPGSDELGVIIERLETIGTWRETREEFDVQIHRHWTDSVWSDWTDSISSDWSDE